MTTGRSSGAAVAPCRARHGLYAFFACLLGLLISVVALVLPSLHPVFWFAGRRFRDAAVSYRFRSGLGTGVTGSYLIAEAIVNVLFWALLIYAAAYLVHRWRARPSSAMTP